MNFESNLPTEAEMFSRFRITFGLALMLSLLTSSTVFAKGKFAFIVVTGAGLKDKVRFIDPSLTTDFFAFANFYRDKAEAPVDPGVGYEITRYYFDGDREIVFDKLHYYPETGYVYYDGVVNGSSEYDHKWYTAQPELKNTFETALYTQLRLTAREAQEWSRAMVPPAALSEDQKQTSTGLIQVQTSAVVMASLLVLLLVGFLGIRRLSPR
jgi:hypothetical protein